MYKIFFIILFFILSVFINKVLAQSDSLIAQWAELLEDDAELVENLQHLLEQPLNINSADKEELLSIPFLTAQMADSIISLRNAKVRFHSKREIRKIIGPEYYDLIKEFITARTTHRYASTAIHRSQLAVEKIDEVRINRYQGNAWNIYNKIYLGHFPNVRGGIITQKDAGEASYWDFISGYFEYYAKNWRIILGSYYLHFGQGLVFSSPFGQRKSSMVIMPFRKLNFGGFASLSSSENTGNFGLYLKGNLFKGFESHLFYMVNRKDGQFDTEPEYVTGFSYDGYHRSIKEETKKDIITENIYGISVIKRLLNQSQIGLTWVTYQYLPDILPFRNNNETLKRNGFYKFSGNQIQQASLFYRFTNDRILFDGEVAFSGSGLEKTALSQSVFFKNKIASFGLKYWRAGVNYQSPSGRIFDDSDAFPRGREGWYIGVSVAPLRQISFNLYKIFHKDLWRTYFSNMPLSKNEWLFQAEYNHRPLHFTARYRSISAEKFMAPISESRKIIAAYQKILRLELNYELNKRLRFKARWETIRVEWLNEAGVNIFQDVQTRIFPWMHFYARVSFFRTAGYASRLYEYESGIPGSFSNYPLFGDGNKWYIMLKTEPLPYLYLWIKYRYYQQNGSKPELHTFTQPPLLLKRSMNIQVQLRF